MIAQTLDQTGADFWRRGTAAVALRMLVTIAGGV